MGERWGNSNMFCGPVWCLLSLWGERPACLSPQITKTSPLNGPVNFLKRWQDDVCVLTKSVGAHSGLHKMETRKSLRMITDKAGAFDTVSNRIFSLAFEFVTRRSWSLSWNPVSLREPYGICSWCFVADVFWPCWELSCHASDFPEDLCCCPLV